MSKRIECDVLEQQLRIDIIVVNVGYLEKHAGDFGEEQADDILLALGAHEVGKFDARPSLGAGHALQCADESALPHRDAGEDDSVLHQLPDNLVTVNEIIGVDNLRGKSSGGAKREAPSR